MLRVYFVGAQATGKCMAYGELMRLADGTLVPVETLIGKQFSVLSADSWFRPVKASALAEDNGVQECVQLTTDRGRRITRTLNHPMWGDVSPRKTEYGTERISPAGDWVQCGDLNVGSVIAAYLGNDGQRSDNVTDDEVKVTGYILGDGGVSGITGIRFSQVAGAALDEFSSSCAALGCTVKHVRGGKSIDYRVIGDGTGGRTNGRQNNPILNRLREWDIQGRDSGEKFLPAWAWHLDNRQLAMLLSRLLACDGWASTPRLRGSNHTSRSRMLTDIGYASKSERLARDTHRALLRLGIQAKLRKKKTSWTHKGVKKVGSAWMVELTDMESILNFSDTIGIYGKEDAVERSASSVRARNWRCSTTRWRKRNIARGFRWERITHIRHLKCPTVAVCVPGNQTYITDFLEHNSTLARQIAADFDLPLITEVVRELKAAQEVSSLDTLRVDLSRAAQFQHQIMKRQIAKELEAGSHFVSDRGCDFLIYSAMHTLVSGSLLATTTCQDYLQGLRMPGRVVFLVQPHKELVRQDHDRSALDCEWDEVVRVAGAIQAFLELQEIPYIPIASRSMRDRVRLVHGVLELAIENERLRSYGCPEEEAGGPGRATAAESGTGAGTTGAGW